MDFSKLSSADKQVVYAAVAVVLLAIVALAQAWGGLVFIPLLGGVGALAVVFMPQMSPTTKLPGSRGSLLLISGGAAALFWALAALTWLNYISRNLASIDTILFLVGLAAALWLGWLSWQAFQAEGGKFVVGASGGAAAAAPSEPAAPPPSEPMASSAPMAPPPQPMAPPSEPMAPPSQPMAPPEPMTPSEPTGSTEEDDNRA